MASEPNKRALEGRCLCGAVLFTARGTFDELVSCHCSQCARWSGSIFTAVTVKTADLTFADDSGLKWFQSSDHGRRGFCRSCGTSLFWEEIGNDETDILAGAFDQPTGLRITGHIYVADKSDYYDILDGAPQFAQARSQK